MFQEMGVHYLQGVGELEGSQWGAGGAVSRGGGGGGVGGEGTSRDGEALRQGKITWAPLKTTDPGSHSRPTESEPSRVGAPGSAFLPSVQILLFRKISNLQRNRKRSTRNP